MSDIVHFKETELPPIKLSSRGSGLTGKLTFFVKVGRWGEATLIEREGTRRAVRLPTAELEALEPGQYVYTAGVRSGDKVRCTSGPFIVVERLAQ